MRTIDEISINMIVFSRSFHLNIIPCYVLCYFMKHEGKQKVKSQNSTILMAKEHGLQKDLVTLNTTLLTKPTLHEIISSRTKYNYTNHHITNCIGLYRRKTHASFLIPIASLKGFVTVTTCRVINTIQHCHSPHN